MCLCVFCLCLSLYISLLLSLFVSIYLYLYLLIFISLYQYHIFNAPKLSEEKYGHCSGENRRFLEIRADRALPIGDRDYVNDE